MIVSRYVKYQKKYINKIKEIIKSAKDVSCQDCGVKYPWYVMDFDHVRGKKRFRIGNAPHKYGMQSVVDEIAKCDVVCANCHRIRTFKSKGIGF